MWRWRYTRCDLVCLFYLKKTSHWQIRAICSARASASLATSKPKITTSNQDAFSNLIYTNISRGVDLFVTVDEITRTRLRLRISFAPLISQTVHFGDRKVI